MTHINRDLNDICCKWCPMYDMCNREYECDERIQIRNLIWKIAGFNDDEDTKI